MQIKLNIVKLKQPNTDDREKSENYYILLLNFNIARLFFDNISDTLPLIFIYD